MIYSDNLALTICSRLAEGQSLREICRAEGMPSRATVYSWLLSNPAFLDQYARAREEQADTLADEILSIVDESPALSIQDRGGDLITVVDGAAIQHQRLRVDARKWVASKLKPKKYGDKTTIAGDGDNPIPVTTKLTVEFVGPIPE